MTLAIEIQGIKGGGRFKVSGHSDFPINPHYDYFDAPDDYGKNLDWTSYWIGSKYWKPGDPYGFKDTK